MKKPLIWVMALVLPVIMAGAGTAGEFYQYTDEKGNMVFTDDITIIPEDQRPEILTHEAVQAEPPPETPAENQENMPDLGPDLAEADEGGEGYPAMGEEDAETDTDAGKSESPVDAFAAEVDAGSPLAEPGIMNEDELDREKARLDALFEELQDEKERLNAISMEKMNNAQRNVHRNKINNVNMRIRAYYREIELFQNKVNEYNARLRQQVEDATRQQ